MTGHAALQEMKEDGWILQKGIQIVEEHVTYPPAKKNPEQSGHGDEVTDLGWMKLAVALSAEMSQQEKTNKEGGNVG